MKPEIHFDIETYSSVDLPKCGVYPYAKSPDFEVLLLAYSYGEGPENVIDLANGEKIPKQLLKDLISDEYTKIAHNALFERVCMEEIGIVIPPGQMSCSAVLASGAGLPMKLSTLSEMLDMGDDGKLSTGTALIRYFCIPCTPTKANGYRRRNLPEHDPVKWEAFKTYCAGDVAAEKAVCRRLKKRGMSEFEAQVYELDQRINDRGILVDETLVASAVKVDKEIKNKAKKELGKITGLANPNSNKQLIEWVNQQEGTTLDSMDKASRKSIVENTESKKVLKSMELKGLLAKTSVSKYTAMVRASRDDGRIRGLFQFYGAGRTGRWAGRLVQVQNLPRNHIDTLDEARAFLRAGDLYKLEAYYKNPSDTLSQLIRTALVAGPDNKLAVCDFSAIEARVLAWLAGEEWRLKAFTEGVDIYKASVARMKNKPLDEVTSEERQEEGKVTELALGYQGSVGALIAMGAEKLGWSEMKMKRIVSEWRAASPEIVKFWDKVGTAALKCVSQQTSVILRLKYTKLIFRLERESLSIQLPSGRKLYYRNVKVTLNKWNRPSLVYLGVIPNTTKWGMIPTYGGKFVENITQAIARDILAIALLKTDKAGIPIVMHVHDEIVAEVQARRAKAALRTMREIMAEPVEWALDLPLKGEGFITNYYLKD